MVRVTREYASDLSQVAAMRALVRQACREAWGQASREATLAELELVLSEAATNIIRHAYREVGDRPIWLEVEVTPEQARLTLYHEGKEFDPGAVAPPAFDGSRQGGFGLYLMRALTDEVTFFHDPAGRCGLRLVKNSRPSSQGE
jgi:serine/threonine-protein kinase RsbW